MAEYTISKIQVGENLYNIKSIDGVTNVEGISPITATVSGETATVSIINASPHYVLAGPASGSAAAAPAFRKLDITDINDIAGAMRYKGTKAKVTDLPATGNVQGDVWHVNEDGSEYAWNGTAWEELGGTDQNTTYTWTSTTVGSASSSGSESVKGINTWSAGTVASLSPTNVTIPNITSVGTTPSLGYDAVTASHIVTEGVAPSFGDSITFKGISTWSAGSAPALTSTTYTIPNVTSVGSLPALTSVTQTIPNVTGVGTLPSLVFEIDSVDSNKLNITWDAGTLASLGTAFTVKGVDTWSAGTLPSLGTSFTVKGINTWSAGSVPSLTSTTYTITPVASVGSMPSFEDVTASKITSWSAGTAPTKGTSITVKSAEDWSAGTAPSLTSTTYTIPIISITDVTVIDSITEHQ